MLCSLCVVATFFPQLYLCGCTLHCDGFVLFAFSELRLSCWCGRTAIFELEVRDFTARRLSHEQMRTQLGHTEHNLHGLIVRTHEVLLPYYYSMATESLCIRKILKATLTCE